MPVKGTCFRQVQGQAGANVGAFLAAVAAAKQVPDDFVSFVNAYDASNQRGG
jgi:hypothetical protein